MGGRPSARGKASGEFAAAGRKADQAGADAVEAEAMLLGGNRDEAKKSADAARSLLDDTASADARVPVLLAGGRVENAFGKTQAARSDVDAAARLADTVAWKSLILETRLAAAEIDASSRAARPARRPPPSPPTRERWASSGSPGARTASRPSSRSPDPARVYAGVRSAYRATNFFLPARSK